MDSTVFDGMRREIGVGVDLEGFGLLEEPRKVIPEFGRVTNRRCSTMGHLMECDKDDDVFLDELFLFVTLSQTHIDLLTLVDGIGCKLCIRSRFCKSLGASIKVLENLFYKGLVLMSLFQ